MQADVVTRNYPTNFGILNLSGPRDSVMAESGLGKEDDIPPGVELKIRPFLKENAQLELKDELKTSVRVYIIM